MMANRRGRKKTSRTGRSRTTTRRMDGNNREASQDPKGNKEGKTKNRAQQIQAYGGEDKDDSGSRQPPQQKQGASSQIKQRGGKRPAKSNPRKSAEPTNKKQPSDDQRRRRTTEKTMPIINSIPAETRAIKHKMTRDVIQTKTIWKHREAAKKTTNQKRKLETAHGGDAEDEDTQGGEARNPRTGHTGATARRTDANK